MGEGLDGRRTYLRSIVTSFHDGVGGGMEKPAFFLASLGFSGCAWHGSIVSLRL